MVLSKIVKHEDTLLYNLNCNFLINLKKFQILQITLLVADYMNMMGKTAPGLLSGAAGTAGTTTSGSSSATPKGTSLSRGQSRASSRARLMTGTPVLNDQVNNFLFLFLTYFANFGFIE
jgi:hypothetical protein